MNAICLRESVQDWISLFLIILGAELESVAQRKKNINDTYNEVVRLSKVCYNDRQSADPISIRSRKETAQSINDPWIFRNAMLIWRQLFGCSLSTASATILINGFKIKLSSWTKTMKATPSMQLNWISKYFQFLFICFFHNGSIILRWSIILITLLYSTIWDKVKKFFNSSTTCHLSHDTLG